MLSESLRGVIAQTLLPKPDGKGRVACIEVLVNTGAVANLIREAKTFQIPSAMQTGRNDGMITFETYVIDLIKKGMVSEKDGASFLGKKTLAGIGGLPPAGQSPVTPGAVGPTSNTYVAGAKMPPPIVKKPA